MDHLLALSRINPKTPTTIRTAIKGRALDNSLEVEIRLAELFAVTNPRLLINGIPMIANKITVKLPKTAIII